MLPTNGMRACTATITEVSYADFAGYEAEVELMTAEEWQAQLPALFQDLLNEDGAALATSSSCSLVHIQVGGVLCLLTERRRDAVCCDLQPCVSCAGSQVPAARCAPCPAYGPLRQHPPLLRRQAGDQGCRQGRHPLPSRRSAGRAAERAGLQPAQVGCTHECTCMCGGRWLCPANAGLLTYWAAPCMPDAHPFSQSFAHTAPSAAEMQHHAGSLA